MRVPCVNHGSYCEMVVGLTWLDRALRPLLAAINADATRAANTLTIFTSDHGNSLTGKGSLYEGAQRATLIA